MADSFEDVISFYADTVVDFLTSTPINYFVGAFMLLIIIKVIRNICY